MAVAYDRHRITLEEYHRMVDAGVFTEESRIELIEGELLEPVSPIGMPHSASTVRINALLVREFGERALVRCQVPITLPNDSEPQPDFSVARYRQREYLDHHPYPEDLLLVIEVADSSRDFDRRRKIPLYGRCGVPEAWVVDVVERALYIYREPCDTGYAKIRTANAGEVIAPEAFPHARLAVDAMLPPLR